MRGELLKTPRRRVNGIKLPQRPVVCAPFQNTKRDDQLRHQ